MNSLISLASLAVVLYLALLAFLYFYQGSILYPSTQAVLDRQALARIGFEEIPVSAADGQQTTSWYLPPTRADGRVLMVFQGNAGHIGHRLEKYEPYTIEGYGLYFVGYRGYSGNPGTPSEEGLIADGLGAYQALLARGVGQEKIILYGESLGSGVALALAADTQVEAAALVLEAAFTSILESAKLRYWFVPVGLLLHDHWRSDLRIAGVEEPLLLLHGDRDRTVPAFMSERLLALAGSPDKTRQVLAGGGHNNLYDFGAVRVVLDFLSRR